MSDSEETMLARLKELEQLLEAEEGMSEEHRAHVHELVAELRSGIEEAHHETFSERLSETALRFEASHPLITRVLLQLSDALGGAGI